MAGIYIHIPFCRKACFYCDFHFSTSLKRREEMVSSLLTELRSRKGELFDAKIESIYFGGGTPSVLNKRELEEIIECIYDNFKVESNAEITLEANPDDCTMDLLRSWRSIGINRLSIGVQSFHQEDLEWMNRSHDSRQAKEALEFAEEAGFDSINLDLIYGLPTMSQDKWKQNIEIAFSLPINHISAYSLTVEQGTALQHFIKTKKYPPLKDSDSEKDYWLLQTAIKDKGWQQYEISNYCKSDNYAKHNTNYWRKKDYLGIGPSAHSFVNGVRRWNIANNANYMKAISDGSCYWEDEKLNPNDVINESIMLGLRTKWGVNYKALESCYGIDILKENDEQIEEFIKSGLIVVGADVITLTDSGRLMADGISSNLFVV